MSTVAVTALSVCTTAAQDLNVIGKSETLDADDVQRVFDRLNTLVDSWAAERGTIFTQAITTYTYPANTPNGVTLGPGGTWNQARPVFLSGANYVVPGSSPEVRIPLELYTDETYFALGIPTLQSALPTGLYLNSQMASPGGVSLVKLYPVPTQAISVGIQTPTQISQFADLTTSYLLPPATRRALHYNLILDICDLFGREPTRRMDLNAFNSKQAMKVPNFQKLVLAIDPAVTSRGGGGYVIYSDTRGAW